MAAAEYIYWHYAVAPRGILGLLRNYLLGTEHLFLISKHLKTLFSPWHRSKPSDIGAPSTFGDKILNAVVDFYVRILAAIIRLVIILIGLVAELIVAMAFGVLMVVWLLWPAIFIFLVSRGLAIIG